MQNILNIASTGFIESNFLNSLLNKLNFCITSRKVVGQT